jgi:hypothetical protein
LALGVDPTASREGLGEDALEGHVRTARGRRCR